MGILADDKAERALIQALQFVRVAIKNGRNPISGELTDVSIAMLMVEMKRRSLAVSFTNGNRG